MPSAGEPSDELSKLSFINESTPRHIFKGCNNLQKMQLTLSRFSTLEADFICTRVFIHLLRRAFNYVRACCGRCKMDVSSHRIGDAIHKNQLRHDVRAYEVTSLKWHFSGCFLVMLFQKLNLNRSRASTRLLTLQLRLSSKCYN